MKNINHRNPGRLHPPGKAEVANRSDRSCYAPVITCYSEAKFWNFKALDLIYFWIACAREGER